MNWLSRLFYIAKDVLRLLTGIGRGQWHSRFIGALFGALSTALGGMVVKVLQFVGLTMSLNTFATPVIMNLIVTPLTGLPAEWQAMIALAHGDRAITIMLSAMTIAVANRVRMRPANPSLWS